MFPFLRRLKDHFCLFLTKLKPFWHELILLASIAAMALVAAGCVAVLVYSKVYENKVYPGVYVGQYHLGGMSVEEAQDFIEGLNNRLAKEGLNFVVDKWPAPLNKFKISNIVLAADGTVEMARLDSNALIEKAVAVGREGGWWQRCYLPFYYLFFAPARLTAPVILSDQNLNEALASNLASFEGRFRDANLKITDLDTLAYEIIPEESGRLFDLEKIKRQMKEELSVLSLAPIHIAAERFLPTVTVADLENLREKIAAVFSFGDIGLNYIDPQTKIRRDWVINKKTISEWLEADKDSEGKIILSLNDDRVKEYLNVEVRPVVDKVSQDAKFTIVDNKVKEFKGSETGESLDVDKTAAELKKVFEERNYHPAAAVKTVSVTTAAVEPQVKLADVNDFGVTDVIGVGISTFRDSHTNRIKNITHAAERLNGTLIKPGEEFSTLKYAGPFTSENGYLPEEVIKGKEIKKEIGGGMCQIGTTMFRMAMNSGMPITERRNHSLVVHYYADPVNGNPGTDATVYEPIVDFKFLNDTGNYLLLQTDINFKKQQLTFTLWGKPDGRKGWYSHPVVVRWISAGEPEEVISDKLKPGEKKCQNAFRGAVAKFTYTRVAPGGEKIDRVFESYYRPLPKICMVGKSEEAQCPEGQECAPAAPVPAEEIVGDETEILPVDSVATTTP